ncbi:MAG: TrkA family potassium uptake protein [Dehalococcoidia bacterium]|nr:TrkA family potassium uptake protein [Dehalococcoidia bacterium]
MYVIIVGAGRVGTAIARRLLENDQEITVIERDQARCSALEDEIGSVVVEGDAAEFNVLSKAGAVRAEALIATGRSDHQNLVICQMAKHLFNVGTVMSIVSVSEHIELFDRLGIDVSIDASLMLVDAFMGSMEGLLTEEAGGP